MTASAMPTDPEVRESRTYWFAILEISASRGDKTAAAQARRELARLGVRVSFHRPEGREAARA